MIPNSSVEWNLTFMNLDFWCRLSCLEQFLHPSLSCVLWLFRSCWAPLWDAPQPESLNRAGRLAMAGCTTALGRWSLSWWPVLETLSSCLSAHEPNSPYAPEIKFIMFHSRTLIFWLLHLNNHWHFLLWLWLLIHSFSALILPFLSLLQPLPPGGSHHWCK